MRAYRISRIMNSIMLCAYGTQVCRREPHSVWRPPFRVTAIQDFTDKGVELGPRAFGLLLVP